MKRLVGLLVVMVIILTGCMGDKPILQPGESQGESMPASSSASSQAIYQDNYAQAAMERMARIDMQDLVSPDSLKRLSKLNINSSVENIKPLSETELAFELCLSTASGGTLRLPIEANCSYDYLQEPLGDFRVEWGGISFYTPSTPLI